jgi:hypothetical protein
METIEFILCYSHAAYLVQLCQTGLSVPRLSVGRQSRRRTLEDCHQQGTASLPAIRCFGKILDFVAGFETSCLPFSRQHHGYRSNQSGM